MIHLRVRTEYSFRRAFGTLERVLACAGGNAMAITDAGTWGHVPFAKAAKKAGVTPLFGLEVLVTPDATARDQKPRGTMAAVLARTDAGLRELYQLMSTANDQFYYVPRLSWDQLNGVSPECWVLSGLNADLDRLERRDHVLLEMSPGAEAWNRRIARGDWPVVVTANNLYPAPADRAAYEILAWQNKNLRAGLMHLASEWELRAGLPDLTEAMVARTHEVADSCTATLPRARMVVPAKPQPLRIMCEDGARGRSLWPLAPDYAARLDRELSMIAEKQFEDYFYVIADLVQEAKRHMLVGPARGSSAGSLVCYLLGITDVDPLRHGLMFERFIDITRADLPDVDIDFQDERRELVFSYLEERYGKEHVGRLGTVMRYKAKSVMNDVSKELGIPVWEVKNVTDAIVERSSGDARAGFAIKDTLEGLEVGRALVAKYPALSIAGELEGHATNTGKHAAGVVVSAEPVRYFCAQSEHGILCIDKKDAEVLNMLKIDALGLRTLSVLADALEQLGREREWLLSYPLDDAAAFEVLNEERYAGIFQFEGFALQNLTRQMKVKEFNDMVAITSLARPGPLHSGAANDFIARRTGREEPSHLHPLTEPITRETLGIVIYQEQVMMITRVVGQLSWEDVSELRKAMSKTLGEEFFNRYWVRFEEGALRQGLTSPEARRIWERVCTFGSWAFNKSHAVSYALISYWCAVLKAHHPLEFAAACLRKAADNEQSVRILRELVRAGYQYRAVDPQKSQLEWSVVDGQLLGGLTNIKGLGVSKATDILLRRAEGRGYQPGQARLLALPSTPFDDLFEGERRFGDWYRNPRAHNVLSGPITLIKDIHDAGEYVFIGRILERNLRDSNEYGNVVKRGGRLMKGQTQFLILTIEDDTSSVLAKIERQDYLQLGVPLIENFKVGDWLMWKGTIRDALWRMVAIRRYVALPADTGEGLGHGA